MYNRRHKAKRGPEQLYPRDMILLLMEPYALHKASSIGMMFAPAGLRAQGYAFCAGPHIRKMTEAGLICYNPLCNTREDWGYQLTYEGIEKHVELRDKWMPMGRVDAHGDYRLRYCGFCERDEPTVMVEEGPRCLACGEMC